MAQCYNLFIMIDYDKLNIALDLVNEISNKCGEVITLFVRYGDTDNPVYGFVSDDRGNFESHQMDNLLIALEFMVQEPMRP